MKLFTRILKYTVVALGSLILVYALIVLDAGINKIIVRNETVSGLTDVKIEIAGKTIKESDLESGGAMRAYTLVSPENFTKTKRHLLLSFNEMGERRFVTFGRFCEECIPDSYEIHIESKNRVTIKRTFPVLEHIFTGASRYMDDDSRLTFPAIVHVQPRPDATDKFVDPYRLPSEAPN